MKKYVPSGYQIIDIDVTGKATGVDFTPTTDDEKILSNLLMKSSKGEVIKPILLRITNDSDHIISFGSIYNETLFVTMGYHGEQCVYRIVVNVTDGNIAVHVNED